MGWCLTVCVSFIFSCSKHLLSTYCIPGLMDSQLDWSMVGSLCCPGGKVALSPPRVTSGSQWPCATFEPPWRGFRRQMGAGPPSCPPLLSVCLGPCPCVSGLALPAPSASCPQASVGSCVRGLVGTAALEGCPWWGCCPAGPAGFCAFTPNQTSEPGSGARLHGQLCWRVGLG